MIQFLLKSGPVCVLICVYSPFFTRLVFPSFGAQCVTLSVYRLRPLIQRALCIVTRRAAVSLRQTHVGRGAVWCVYPGDLSISVLERNGRRGARLISPTLASELADPWVIRPRSHRVKESGVCRGICQWQWAGWGLVVCQSLTGSLWQSLFIPSPQTLSVWMASLPLWMKNAAGGRSWGGRQIFCAKMIKINILSDSNFEITTPPTPCPSVLFLPSWCIWALH